MATHLNPTTFQLSDLYGGRERIKDLSGWEGDTTYNANDMKPSIGEDDYKSDLDSVNIISRMAQGQTYQQAMITYYQALAQTPSLREQEFLQSNSWSEVKGKIYMSLVPAGVLGEGEESTKDYIKQHYPGVYTFLVRLEGVR